MTKIDAKLFKVIADGTCAQILSSPATGTMENRIAREAAQEGYFAGLRVASLFADKASELQECEMLGYMDPETGMRECSLDVRGSDCLCIIRSETAECLRDTIRRELPGFCDQCGKAPVRTELDGDELCQGCANKWVQGEGQSAMEVPAP